MITQERLKELFYYNPEDGNLYNRFTRGSKAKKGTVAGTLNTIVHNRCTPPYVQRYWHIKIEGKIYKAHRLIWIYHFGDIEEGYLIDHISGDTLNNRIENLRSVTRQGNARNTALYRGNKSGCAGVYKNTLKDGSVNWRVIFNINGKNVNFGTHSNYDEAVAIRKKLEQEHGYHPNHCNRIGTTLL